MPNQQLTDFIKQSRAAGISDDQIKQNLINSGWQEAEIIEAFGFLRKTPENIPESEKRIALKVIFAFFAVGWITIILTGIISGISVSFLTGSLFKITSLTLLLPPIFVGGILLIYLRLGYFTIGRQSIKYGYKIVLFLLWASLGSTLGLFLLPFTYVISYTLLQ